MNLLRPLCYEDNSFNSTLQLMVLSLILPSKAKVINLSCLYDCYNQYWKQQELDVVKVKHNVLL